MADKYFYQGCGFALGGYFKRPWCENIEAQAQVVLPSVGGNGTALMGPFRHRGVSFEEAYAEVSGSHDERKNEFNTLVTVWVKRLNILNVVTADAVTARLTAVKKADKNEKPQISFSGSHFVNLRIAGEKYEERLRISDLSDDLQVTSAQELVYIAEGCQQPVLVPNFGKVYIAEIAKEQHSARLTMLRLELGSPVEGELVGVMVEGGGRGW